MISETTSQSFEVNYFLKQTDFKYNPRSVYIFFGLCITVWFLSLYGQVLFPPREVVPYLISLFITAMTVLLFGMGTAWLLKQNNLSSEALGLKLSLKSLTDFFLGIFIGIAGIVLMGLLFYLLVPFHFIAGNLQGSEILKRALNFLGGNAIEELMFRGFPLLILSQLMGWRKAVWVMALPFGLSHLLGTGINMEGLKMVATTSAYSFVFSYAFILTGSLWTAIGLHAATNVMLHTISGLDGSGNAMIVPVFDADWPSPYVPPFLFFMMTTLLTSVPLYLLINKKFRSDESASY